MENIEIIGKGEIWDKAKQLIKKTPYINKIGLHTPNRTILAEDFFDWFTEKNKLEKIIRKLELYNCLEEKIKKGSITKNQYETIQYLQNKYKKTFAIAIRSSAAWDARGTGIYRSNFVDNTITEIKRWILDVLASYYTENALLFRKDANTWEGMGIIIEPLIGQIIEKNKRSLNYAPLLSWYGYTSTPQWEWYINIVPWLWGGVDHRNGQKITQRDMEWFHWDINELIESLMRDRIYNPRKKTSRLAEYDSPAYVYWKTLQTNDWWTKYRSNIEVYKHNINLSPLFETMKKMEDKFKHPQYIEWAFTNDKKSNKYRITQIDDIKKNKEEIEFQISENTLLIGKDVFGTWTKTCNLIVHCWNHGDIKNLYTFNQTHKDYIVIFSSRLTTKSRMWGWWGLDYRDLSNASVIIEIQDAPHADSAIGHFGGQIEATNKFFAVLDYHAVLPPQWDELNKHQTEINWLRVEDIKTQITANERKNVLIIDMAQKKS